MAYKTDGYKLADALDPANSVFVAANAGAGKTTLLTQRVLRLLLHGVLPGKILCLTFTNAAAAEMSSRVLTELGKWVMADDEKLSAQLMMLTGNEPDKKSLEKARSLFARVLESPEGIRIQTLHGFCQSLLRRFPVEAGISPHFTVMDAGTEKVLLQEAKLRLFNRAQTEDTHLNASLTALTQALSESSFFGMVNEILKNKRRLRWLFSHKDGVEQAATKIRSLLKIPHGCTEDTLIEKYFSYTPQTLQQLRSIAATLLKSDKKTDIKTGQGLADWLSLSIRDHASVDAYITLLLTDKYEPRKKLYTKDALHSPEMIDTLLTESITLMQFVEARKSLRIALSSIRVIHLAEALLSLYDKIKTSHALMDYDDLIMITCRLLQTSGIADWVLYKLDGGIDHILVDEAQDTSQEQWLIVDALTQEFFSGKGSRDYERSLFIVGDEKQSIFSFQGAAPQALGKMQAYFAKRIEEASCGVQKIALTRSFRSTREVLTAVDAVFSHALARTGLMFSDAGLVHEPTRLDHAGLVEIWPMFVEKEDENGEVISARTCMVRGLATTIKGWLDNGVMLEAKRRPVEAGDIMILVQNRTTLVDSLVRSFKKHGIPVAGVDRMVLIDNIAVQDLIALGQVLLLPEDDLTLAALLKSPLFSISEDDLFSLCWQRHHNTLWGNIRNLSKSRTDLEHAYDLIADLRARVDFLSPYELYTYLLETLGGRKRIIGRMGDEHNDPVDEFLMQALLYERSHAASLQGFLHWLTASDNIIKRDMEQVKNCVRIMTVHGAKGLQAPIVILPDTTRIKPSSEPLLWYSEDARTFPFCAGGRDNEDIFCKALHMHHDQEMEAERRRLLYVALTRAEDRLYICGATNKEQVQEHTWYQLIKTGLEPIASPFQTPWGDGLRFGAEPEYSNRPKAFSAVNSVPAHTLDFLLRPPLQEPTPSQPLVPSRLGGQELAVLSPLSAPSLYQRGTLVHRLLQYLPEVQSSERHDLAHSIAASFRSQMTRHELESAVSEALLVIENPNFSFLFGHNSFAEVPIAGSLFLEGTPVAVSGQIDRLCVGRDEVWVVDFKSNLLPPAQGVPIPAVYLQQMRLYYLLLKQIYKGKTIRCALLWTIVPQITVLDEAILDEVHVSSYI